MLNLWNWEKFGDLTPEQSVELAQSVLDCYMSTNEDIMIGEFVNYISDNPPYGVLECVGQTLSNISYPQLAAALPDTFDNGDGTFTLPDFRGRTLIGAGTGSGLTARDIGDTGGEETHDLVIGEIPSHQHTVTDADITGLFVAPGEVPAVIATTFSLTGAAGGDNPHNNMQPFGVGHIGVRYASPLLNLPTLILQRNIGEVVAMATSAAPTGYLACDGSSHLRVDYPDLYAAIHTTFHTDADHFVTPDMRSRTVIGVGQGAGLTNRSMNDEVGEETHLLTTAETPAHTHGVGRGTTAGAGTGVVRATNQTTTQLTDSTGGGGAHQNMQPSRALQYYIVAENLS
jgi:microcystin-dependent protein